MISYRRVQKTKRATNYHTRFWSLVMVRNQLPAQVVKYSATFGLFEFSTSLISFSFLSSNEVPEISSQYRLLLPPEGISNNLHYIAVPTDDDGVEVLFVIHEYHNWRVSRESVACAARLDIRVGLRFASESEQSAYDNEHAINVVINPPSVSSSSSVEGLLNYTHLVIGN